MIKRIRIWWAERRVRRAYDWYHLSFNYFVSTETARKRELPKATRVAKADFNRALDALIDVEPDRECWRKQWRHMG
jgi:hypothetical protein